MPAQRDDGYWRLGIDFLDSGNYIAVNRSLVKLLGLDSAVLIGELASEARYWDEMGKLDDGWFFSTVENVETSTGLSAYRQRKAVSALVDMGVIEMESRGLPKTRYFRVVFPKLLTLVNDKSLKNCPTVDEKIGQLEAKNVPLNNYKEQQQRTTTKKERKKENTFDAIIAERTDNDELVSAIGEFIRMRERIKKPLTDYALRLRLKKLWELGSTDDERIAIVNQSVGACWQDFYELKTTSGDKEDMSDYSKYDDFMFGKGSQAN